MTKKKTILIIDDEVGLTELLKIYIEERRQDYQVVLAHNGEDGLEKINNIRPALVILDIQLPKMGGIEVFKHIAATDGRAKVPVLVFTARGELGDFFDNMDVDGFISKPFNIKHMLSEVDRIISGKGKQIVFLLDLKSKTHTKDISDTLRKIGYRVLIIEDEDSLRNACREANPDFVVMEFEQKKMNGEGFIKRIKNAPSTKSGKLWPSEHRVSVIVYTYSGADYRKKSMDAGADMYIGKPANVEAIDLAIKEIRVNLENETERQNVMKLERNKNSEEKHTPGVSDIDFFKF